MASLYHPTGTAVDDRDSNEITAAYLTKFKSIGRLDNALAPRLFDYACLNLRKSTFENNLSQIVLGTFERAWAELSRAHELSMDQWGAFTICIMEILSMLIGQVHLAYLLRNPVTVANATERYRLCKSNPKHIRAIVTIASSKDLFEYLGRLLLFPLSPLGKGIIGKHKP